VVSSSRPSVAVHESAGAARPIGSPPVSGTGRFWPGSIWAGSDYLAHQFGLAPPQEQGAARAFRPIPSAGYWFFCDQRDCLGRLTIPTLVGADHARVPVR